MALQAISPTASTPSSSHHTLSLNKANQHRTIQLSSIPHHCSPIQSSSTKRPARPAFKRSSPSTPKTCKRVSIDIPLDPVSDTDDSMASSFNQFCTVCENQIIAPNNAILYCSEGCRRKDMHKPLSSEILTALDSPPLTPTNFNNSLNNDASPPPDIIPQRSPTAPPGPRFSYGSTWSVASSDNELEPENSDDQSHQRRPRMHRRNDSDAARYLRQFHSPAYIAEASATTSRRPKPQSSASTASLAPSLTHSPSPGTSPASVTPMMSSLPYHRPLPPRTNPYSSSTGSKSISLVNPWAGSLSTPPRNESSSSLPGLKSKPSVATNVGADELPSEQPGFEAVYEKKAMADKPAPSEGTLKTLFRFDQMQAPPNT